MPFNEPVSFREISNTIHPKASTVFSERLALGRLAAEVKSPRVIVEIGTFDGGTAEILRRFNTDAKIFSVDIAPRANAYKVAAQHGVELVIGDSAEAAKTVAGDVGLLFIDGSHSIDDALRDWAAWAPRCVGASVAFHDYSPRFPGIRTLVDTLAGTGRLADARCTGLSAFGKIAEPSAPTEAELFQTMDLIAQWYLNLATTLTGISVSGKVRDVTGELISSMPCTDIPIRIVGKGVRGVKTAGALWRGFDSCIDSSEASDPSCFYVIAGSPEDAIRETLINKGIPAHNILDQGGAEALLGLFNCLAPVKPDREGPLSAALRAKLTAAFAGKEALFDRFRLFTHPDVSPNPDDPPIA